MMVEGDVAGVADTSDKRASWPGRKKSGRGSKTGQEDSSLPAVGYGTLGVATAEQPAVTVSNPMFPADGEQTTSASAPALQRTKTGLLEEQQHDDGGCASCRWHIRNFVDHPITQLIVITLILADIVILCLDIAGVSDSNNYRKPDFYIAMFIILTLTGEVALRMFALGLTDFLKDWVNILDTGIVTFSIIFQLLSAFSFVPLRLIRPFVRVIRAVRVLVKIRQQTRTIPRVARLYVTQNKRRFRKYGFDLDLAYITDCVIGMSVPAIGKEAIYRNPIRDVARFFAKYHRDHFHIWNLCMEREYRTDVFDNRVDRVRIVDHSVPLLSTIWRVCEKMKKWMAQDYHNVIVVHCKGGKGRTGTMICSWLLFNKEYKTAQEALQLFATRRTDEKIKGKLQGVDTKSQVRYIGYFEKVVKAGRLPPVRFVEIKSIHINMIPNVEKLEKSSKNLLKMASSAIISPNSSSSDVKGRSASTIDGSPARRKTIEHRQTIFTSDHLEAMGIEMVADVEEGEGGYNSGSDNELTADDFQGMSRPWFTLAEAEEDKINHYDRAPAELEQEEASGRYPLLSLVMPLMSTTQGISVEVSDDPDGSVKYDFGNVKVRGDAKLSMVTQLKNKDEKELLSFNFHTSFLEDEGYVMKLGKYDLDYPQKTKKLSKKLIQNDFEMTVTFAPC